MIDHTMSKVKRSSVTTRQSDLGSSCSMKLIHSISAYLLYPCSLLQCIEHSCTLFRAKPMNNLPSQTVSY